MDPFAQVKANPDAGLPDATVSINKSAQPAPVTSATVWVDTDMSEKGLAAVEKWAESNGMSKGGYFEHLGHLGNTYAAVVTAVAGLGIKERTQLVSEQFSKHLKERSRTWVGGAAEPKPPAEGGSVGPATALQAEQAGHPCADACSARHRAAAAAAVFAEDQDRADWTAGA